MMEGELTPREELENKCNTKIIETKIVWSFVEYLEYGKKFKTHMAVVKARNWYVPITKEIFDEMKEMGFEVKVCD